MTLIPNCLYLIHTENRAIIAMLSRKDLDSKNSMEWETLFKKFVEEANEETKQRLFNQEKGGLIYD